MAARKYDSSVARIAGNIASGLVTVPAGLGTLDTPALVEWMQSVTKLSVGLARAIVAETIATEPEVTTDAVPGR